LIDATLVRIVIGPALLRIAGDWNWWPGGLPKRARSAWAWRLPYWTDLRVILRSASYRKLAEACVSRNNSKT